MSLKNLSVVNKIPKYFENKLKNKKISLIYKSFEKSLNLNKDFIVAVSGGPDSLALAFLSKIYSIKKNLISRFYIIDHKLRKDSTKEAKKVRNILKKHFIHSEILTWKGKKPIQNIQALARKKRYELLFSKSDKFKVNNILLGHHQDDLLENFFLRILRGSGLKGLVSLDKKSKIKNKILFRPLLGQKKKDLIFVSKFIFNFFVKDPSNNDDKYQRIKIRKLILELEKNGLDMKKFLKTINNLKHSNNVVDFFVSENLMKNTYYFSNKKKLLLNQDFFKNPYEIIFRSFSDSLQLIGSKYYPVRGKKLDKVLNDIAKKQSFKVTLGGCIIEKVNQTVIISKEH